MITNNKKQELPREVGITYDDAKPKVPFFLDPIKRFWLANFLKWMLLAGILMIIAWIPSHYYPAWSAVKGAWTDNWTGVADKDGFCYYPTPKFSKPVDKETFNTAFLWFHCSVQVVGGVFAAIFATLVPRFFLPREWLGRWNDAAQAFRDWIVVGLLVGIYYSFYIIIAKRAGSLCSPQGLDWYKLRGLLGILPGGLLVYGITALFRRGREREENGSVPLPIQTVLFSVLLLLAFPLVNGAVGKYSMQQPLPLIVCIIGVALVVIVFAVLAAAYGIDRKVTAIHRLGGRTHSDTPKMTITVVGGRAAGKTTFLAGAYWQWTMDRAQMGPFSIESLQHQSSIPTSGSGAYEPPRFDYDIKTVAENLYQNRCLPPGTVSCQDLPFALNMRERGSLREYPAAQFHVLDYPGGSLKGQASNEAIAQFKAHLKETDALLLIADMSNARRNQRDQDFLDVIQAYQEIMDFVLAVNGKYRVVPVAMVLTKCDEFFDFETGEFDMARSEDAYRRAQYHKMEEEWDQKSKRDGPGFSIFRKFYTSALTFTQPAPNDPGRTLPYVMSAELPKPNNCALPLLWLSREMMHWNVTLASDLTTFLLGSTPRYRRRVAATQALEQVIREMINQPA